MGVRREAALRGARVGLQPARAVTGPGVNGGYGVADPRVLEAVQLGCEPRAGTYGVIGWEQAAATVTGSVSIDNGTGAVADPRDTKELPVIVASDGTWHRPITTLEFAALQGISTILSGKPLQLAGKSSSAWRERIGNAVPVQAAKAIADSLLTALVATAWVGGAWVAPASGSDSATAGCPTSCASPEPRLVARRVIAAARPAPSTATTSPRQDRRRRPPR